MQRGRTRLKIQHTSPDQGFISTSKLSRKSHIYIVLNWLVKMKSRSGILLSELELPTSACDIFKNHHYTKLKYLYTYVNILDYIFLNQEIQRGASERIGVTLKATMKEVCRRGWNVNV